MSFAYSEYGGETNSRDACVRRVRARRRELGRGIRRHRRRRHRHAGPLEGLDEGGARKGGRILDAEGPYQLGAAGQWGPIADGDVTLHRAGAANRPDALHQPAAGQRDRIGCPRGGGGYPSVHAERARARPPVDGRGPTLLGGRDGHVDHVLVDHDRRDQQVLVRHPEALEESVVDDDVAGHAPDSRRPHLLGQTVEAVQRVLGRQDRRPEVVRVVVVEVRERDGAVGVQAATEREITGGHQDKIADQRALRIDRAPPVDRGHEAMIGAELLQGEADREQLADRAGQGQLVGVKLVQGLAGRHVGDEEAPGRPRVAGFLHHGRDGAGQGVVRRRRAIPGCQTARPPPSRRPARTRGTGSGGSAGWLPRWKPNPRRSPFAPPSTGMRRQRALHPGQEFMAPILAGEHTAGQLLVPSGALGRGRSRATSGRGGPAGLLPLACHHQMSGRASTSWRGVPRACRLSFDTRVPIERSPGQILDLRGIREPER